MARYSTDSASSSIARFSSPRRFQAAMRSSVSLNLPLPFADRIAAWKRRGELQRAIDELAESVG